MKQRVSFFDTLSKLDCIPSCICHIAHYNDRASSLYHKRNVGQRSANTGTGGTRTFRSKRLTLQIFSNFSVSLNHPLTIPIRMGIIPDSQTSHRPVTHPFVNLSHLFGRKEGRNLREILIIFNSPFKSIPIKQTTKPTF